MCVWCVWAYVEDASTDVVALILFTRQDHSELVSCVGVRHDLTYIYTYNLSCNMKAINRPLSITKTTAPSTHSQGRCSLNLFLAALSGSCATEQSNSSSEGLVELSVSNWRSKVDFPVSALTSTSACCIIGILHVVNSNIVLINTVNE